VRGPESFLERSVAPLLRLDGAGFMPVKTFRPLTPSTRYITVASFDEITKDKPSGASSASAKNRAGAIIMAASPPRHRQGAQTDFTATWISSATSTASRPTVTAIEYDPIRTARLALLQYKGRREALHHRPGGLQVGAKIDERPVAPPEVGNCLPLKAIPVGLPIHNIEMTPGAAARWSAPRAARRR
jgi:large subunit ribosomal protein L2